MEKKKLTTKQIWLRVLLVILVILLVAVIAGFATVRYFLDRIGSAYDGTDPFQQTIPPHLEDFETRDPTEDDITDDVTKPSETIPTQPPETEPTQPSETQPTEPPFEWPTLDEVQSKDVINILLIGWDEADSMSQARSDSMILLSINRKTSKIHLTSFLRDLYVQIPGGYSDNKLNAAFRFGGTKLLNETIELNFGITIDGNAAVNYEQFANIVQYLGGVDIELTAKEAEHMTNTLDAGPLQEGMNHLNGWQALLYCRIRKLDSDFGRTNRQRKVLTAIADSFRSADIGTLFNLMNNVLPYIYTDLSDTDILRYAFIAFSIFLGGGEIESGRVPQSGHFEYAIIKNMDVVLPDMEKCRQYLQEVIYGA